MTALAWAAVAGVVAAGLQRALRDTMRTPALMRLNYAGRHVATAGGVVAVAAFVVTAAAMFLADESLARLTYRAAIVVLGFGFIGLFDDVVGDHAVRGLRGNFAAARRGQLTSGGVKLLFGLAVAGLATLPFVDGAEARALQVVLIAGAANVANLLDLAPARATKVAAVALVPLVAVYRPTTLLVGPLCFVVAVAALAVAEVREEVMLGDTGSNALGAAVGLAFATAVGSERAWMWLAAFVVVAVNVAGEFVSFSRVIERVPPLRIFDQLGRRR